MYNWWYKDGKETGAQFGKTEVEGENNFVQRHTSSLVAELRCTHKSNADLITLLSASKYLFNARIRQSVLILKLRFEEYRCQNERDMRIKIRKAE